MADRDVARLLTETETQPESIDEWCAWIQLWFSTMVVGGVVTVESHPNIHGDSSRTSKHLIVWYTATQGGAQKALTVIELLNCPRTNATEATMKGRGHEFMVESGFIPRATYAYYATLTPSMVPSKSWMSFYLTCNWPGFISDPTGACYVDFNNNLDAQKQSRTHMKTLIKGILDYNKLQFRLN